MNTRGQYVFFAVILLATAGFTNQPMNERQAQDTLPQSKHELWKSLAACKVGFNEKTYMYNIAFTPEVKAMSGKKVTISGFMLPLEPAEKFKHFLLSKRTPTCPFCPPGEPNEVIDVYAASPVRWAENLVTLTGTFALVSDGEKGLFFQMTDAAEQQ